MRNIELARTGFAGLAVLCGLVLSGMVSAGGILGPASDQATTLDIVLEGPADAAGLSNAEIQVRVFEGEDPDAPPQVTNIAFKTFSVAALAFPMTLHLEAPTARLLGALQPAVGVLVLSNGSMVYWNGEIAPLSRDGPTTVMLAMVP